MKKLLSMTVMLLFATSIFAQGPGGGGSTTTTPNGATYTLSDGSSVTKTSESLSNTTADYNVVQVTNGTLNMNECTITKSGDTENDGDATSFYGTNSAVYVGGSNAVINMTGGSITTSSKGSNAGFAYNGGTLNISNVTINNFKTVSRGLHATYGGIINATDVTITTQSETSSTIATDRGGGYVYVWGGTATAKGNRSAVTLLNRNHTSTSISRPFGTRRNRSSGRR